MVILTLSHLSELIALEEQISVTIIFKRLFIFFLFKMEWTNDIIGGEGHDLLGFFVKSCQFSAFIYVYCS